MDLRLLLAWVVLLHLVADFVVQTDGMARGKERPGWPGMGGIAGHALIVALCFAPVAVVFTGPGVAFVVVVGVTHAVIDWLKAWGTRGVAGRLVPPAAPPTGTVTETSLGAGWTALPAAYFILDQLAHVAIVLAAAWSLLRDTVPTTFATDLTARLAAGADPADFHRLVLVLVVAASVVIVNVQAAALFVNTLLQPVRTVTRTPSEPVVDRPPESAVRRYRIEIGRLTGRVEAEPSERPLAVLAPPLNVGRAIGVVERLLITLLVMARADAAIALVVGVKTIARFRQLDDRSFAEYYLLGTLASVSIGIAAGLAARLVLEGV